MTASRYELPSISGMAVQARRAGKTVQELEDVDKGLRAIDVLAAAPVDGARCAGGFGPIGESARRPDLLLHAFGLDVHVDIDFGPIGVDRREYDGAAVGVAAITGGVAVIKLQRKVEPG